MLIREIILNEDSPAQLTLYRTTSSILPSMIDHQYNRKLMTWKLGKGTYYSTSIGNRDFYALNWSRYFGIVVKYKGNFNNLLILTDYDLQGLKNVFGLQKNTLTVTDKGAAKLELISGQKLDASNIKIPNKYDGVYFPDIHELLIPITVNHKIVTPILYGIVLHEWLDDIAHDINYQVRGKISYQRGKIGKLVDSVAGSWVILFSPNNLDAADNAIRQYLPDLEKFSEDPSSFKEKFQKNTIKKYSPSLYTQFS